MLALSLTALAVWMKPSRNYQAGQYDVVISDYEMPQKDGLQFLTELRKQNNNIPFILFTGKGREEVAIKALNLGADGYYNKQGNPETVYGELAHGIKIGVEHWKSKQELIERESKYQNIFNNSEVGMFRTKLDGSEILDFNEKYLSIFGFTREEMQGKHSTSFWADPLKRQEMVRLLQANGYVKDFECKMLNKQHGIRNCLTSLKLYPEQGILEGTIIDITERKNAEEKLKESEKKYQTTFEASMDALMLLDDTGFFDCNKATLGLFGCSSVDEFTKFHPADLSPPTQPDGTPSMDAAMSHIQKAFQTGSDHFFWIHKRADGPTFPADVLLTRMSLKGREVLQATVRDITELKKAEVALVESEANYRNLINGMDESVWVIDFDGNFLEVNNVAVEMLEYSREELQSLGIKGIDNYLSPEQVKNLMSRVASGETQVFETVHTAKDGTEIPVEISSSLITYHGKQAILATARDITKRKKTEETIKLSELRFRLLYENSSDAVLLAKPDGTNLSANPAACRMFGMSEEEFKKTGREIVVVDARFEAAIKERERTGRTKAELTLRRKDGSTFEGEATSTLFLDSDGSVKASMIIRDISERKKVEESLHESQQKFKALFSANPDAAVFLDIDFHVVEANSRFSTLFGYSLDEIKGKIITDLIVPDDSKEESKILRQKIISGSVEIVTTRKRKDGSQIPLFMSGGPVFVNGKLIGSIMVYKDISDIITVQEELSKALDKAELLNEKLRVVGSLTRHDVRNKLSAVNGYAYLLKKKYADQADIVEGL